MSLEGTLLDAILSLIDSAIPLITYHAIPITFISKYFSIPLILVVHQVYVNVIAEYQAL